MRTRDREKAKGWMTESKGDVVTTPATRRAAGWMVSFASRTHQRRVRGTKAQEPGEDNGEMKSKGSSGGCRSDESCLDYVIAFMIAAAGRESLA